MSLYTKLYIQEDYMGGVCLYSIFYVMIIDIHCRQNRSQTFQRFIYTLYVDIKYFNDGIQIDIPLDIFFIWHIILLLLFLSIPYPYTLNIHTYGVY